MDINIYDYVSEEEMIKHKQNIEDNEIKDIYKDEKIKISLMKSGKKILTFINEFGEKKLNDALNEMVKLV